MEFSIEEFNEPSKSFKHNYIKLCKLGNGAFGKVYKAKEVKTDNIVAVKQLSISNSKTKYEHYLKEINVLSNLSHPNIVKYYNYYEENNKIYIIMEYLEGGTLKQYINEEKNNITEDVCRIIIKQILKALSYLHYTCDICHRDIKPENIMFKYKDNPNSIKLIDFGLSSNSFEKKNYLDNCGTLIYMAPEQISNKTYSKSVDIWSVGIILYMLLNNGKNPFYNSGDSRETIIEKITSKNIEYDDINYPISEMGKHFISKLLKKNSSSRYTARPALNHPWITMQKFEKIPMTVLDKLLIGSYVNIINEFFLTALFMNYFKKNNLNLNSQINIDNTSFSGSLRKSCYTSHSNIMNNKFNNVMKANEVNKSNYYLNNFDLDEYFQRVKKSNLLLEKKFKENREIMFITKKDKSKSNLNIITNDKEDIVNNINEIKNVSDTNLIIVTKKKNNIIYNIKNYSNKNLNKSKIKNKTTNNNISVNNDKNKIKNMIRNNIIPPNNNSNLKIIELKKLPEFLNKDRSTRNKSQNKCQNKYNGLFSANGLLEVNKLIKSNTKDKLNNFINNKINIKNQNKKNLINLLNNYKNITSSDKVIMISRCKNKSVENLKNNNFNKNNIKNNKLIISERKFNYNYFSTSDKNNNKFLYTLSKKNNNFNYINGNAYNEHFTDNKIKPKKLFEEKINVLPKIDQNKFH